MTREQTIEAEKTIPLLNACREYLDNARFRMGPIDDESYNRLSRMYDHVCKALDET